MRFKVYVNKRDKMDCCIFCCVTFIFHKTLHHQHNTTLKLFNSNWCQNLFYALSSLKKSKTYNVSLVLFLWLLFLQLHITFLELLEYDQHIMPLLNCQVDYPKFQTKRLELLHHHLTFLINKVKVHFEFFLHLVLKKLSSGFIQNLFFF
jgi:hypothetical protein